MKRKRKLVTTITLLSVFSLLMGGVLMSGCAIKPVPLTNQEQAKRALIDHGELFKDQKPLKGDLTLPVAISRALAYNYDHKLAIMESVLADKNIGVITMKMLPDLAANAGYVGRNNELASSSISYQTRQQTLEPSVSTDKQLFLADLSLSWSVLDFGVSYYQAKQQADRYLAAMERRRRVVNNIVKEVIAAYWRAVTAQRLLPLIDPALAQADDSMQRLKEMEKQSLQPVVTTLTQQKAMMQLIGNLRRLKANLALSKVKLAALVNLPFGQDFTIVMPTEGAPPSLGVSIDNLELLGLYHRPDLREMAYHQRISRLEARKELLRLLPGINLNAGGYYDSNSFLVNNFWGQAGARVSFSLIKLLTIPQQLEASEAQEKAVRIRSLAMTVAALTQIHLSYYQYSLALDSYNEAKEVANLDNRILAAVSRAAEAQADSELDKVRRTMSTITSALQRDRSLADVYQALGDLYFSVGIDIAPCNMDLQDPEVIARNISTTLERWQSGQFPEVPQVLYEEQKALTPGQGNQASEKSGPQAG